MSVIYSIQDKAYTLTHLTIAISGEVYKDYSSFHPRVCETLKTLISDQVAAKLSVGIVKHSRIVGAAIVAMMAEKINPQY